MVKKCIICEEQAAFKIKDTVDFYCKTCALENFADLTMLLTLEEEAKLLKKVIEDRLSEQDIGEESIVVTQTSEE
jgi:hypothetical protein